MDFIRPDVVVYHDCCSDGFGCKYVCEKKWKNENIKYVPQNFKKESFSLNNLNYEYENKKILFLDFVYDEENLIIDLEKHAKNLCIIDHHQSAYNKYSNKEYAYFNQDKSAAVLTWESLFPDYEVPLILKYIEDRDLRNFNLPYVHQVLAVLDSDYKMNVKDWDDFSFRLENQFEDIVEKGNIILKKRKTQIENLSNNHCEIEINGISGLLANAIKWDFASEVAEKLAEKSNFGFAWFKDEHGQIKCSLRSNNGTNVRVLAESIGGGGHDNSSGATVSIEKIKNLTNNKKIINLENDLFLNTNIFNITMDKIKNEEIPSVKKIKIVK